MQFKLPSNLQTELLAYDPKLKALAKQQENKKPTAKPKFPLGKIPCLIPTNIVREADQLEAIAHINQQLAPDRYQLFSTPVDVATPRARLKVIAILYHYEQVWYAAWLPHKNDKGQYIYGHAYAFKNTSATANTAPSWIWNSKDKCVVHDIGRGSQLFVHTAHVTCEHIRANVDRGWSDTPWRAANLYTQKGRTIREQVVDRFDASLREDIPIWEDSRGLFDRLRCKTIFDAAEIPGLLSKCMDVEQGLTVDNIINASIKQAEVNYYPSTTYLIAKNLKDILSKPAIRKLLQAELDRSTQAYEDPANTHRAPVRQGFGTFVQIISSIDWIHEVWNDCPIDYYQTYFNELKYIKLSQIRKRSYETHSSKLIYWLREHMPVASMFTILRKHIEDAGSYRWVDSDVGYARCSFSDLNDTFSMMIKIFESGAQLEPPKRWRINEFHDYVQAEAWKIKNPKESLHQDLFPEPIKVTCNDQTWTFFQPVDTHQLAMWGQAVRNCVGDASHYADDIKKRKHFIVLCMIDGKPKFTIQLVVDQGMMSVKQIVGVANKRLDYAEEQLYTSVFSQVLQERENQLTCS